MTFKGSLLPYQVDGVDTMVTRGNALVAYDMGLGKTVLAIAAIERLMDEEQISEPGLVVCPSSLAFQWAESVSRFSNSRALVINGTPTQRAKQYDQAREWWDSEVDYIVLSYSQVVGDWDEVKTLPKGFLVIDEANAVKSFRSKRSKRVKELSKDIPFRYALTGTPADNGRAEEVFSLMQVVDPSVLGNPRKFDATYIKRTPQGWITGYRNLDDFRARLKPVLLRKRQQDPDVAPYLPATIHPAPIQVRPNPAFQRLYKRIAKDLADELKNASDLGINSSASFSVLSAYGIGAPSGGDKDSGQVLGRVASRIQALRLLCCDPILLDLAEGEYVAGLRDEGIDFSKAGSPKIKALETYVNDHLESYDKHKVVIFTHWLGMTEILRRTFEKHGAVTFTGRMNAKEKEAAKKKFQTDPDTRVFISSDAGGYGVDLPQASMLVNADPAETSGSQAQRNARIQRASSTWPSITIQDIVVTGTIEERIHESLAQKTGVQAALIDGKGIDKNGGLNLTLGSLSSFLQTNS